MGAMPKWQGGLKRLWVWWKHDRGHGGRFEMGRAVRALGRVCLGSHLTQGVLGWVRPAILAPGAVAELPWV
jgi:hypothetical protein